MDQPNIFLKIGRVLINCAHIAYVEDDGERVHVHFAQTEVPNGHLEFSGDDAARFREQMNQRLLANQGLQM